jgi:trehalose 6-phosphate phosphatase
MDTSALADPSTLVQQSDRFALFLDFDGVLVDLAETPDAVVVSDKLRSRLEKLNGALGGAVAVVSGRGLQAIDDFLFPTVLAVAGDHGNQRRTSSGEIEWENTRASVAASALYELIKARVGNDDRLLVEQKASAVALHYRLAPERGRECIEWMEAAVQREPALSIVFGKMVVEARAHGVTKGEAVRKYMEEPPFADRVPVFIGDDVTDEDGFVAVQERGGIGIKVGEGQTAARLRMRDTAEVANFLDAIVETREGAH